MNNGWMGKGDGVGGGSRGRGRGRGDLTRVKPLKPAKEVSDEKRSRGGGGFVQGYQVLI